MSECRSPISREAGEALAAKRLVKGSASEDAVVYCDGAAGDIPLGVNDYYVADGDTASVKVLNQDGTQEVTAAGAITRFAEVYMGADGKVQGSAAIAGGKPIGIAMEAATTDGDIIEVIFYPPYSPDAGAYTLTAAAPAIVPGTANQIDSSSNAVDATLAAGSFIGQQTRIVMTEASNSSTVTVAAHETSDPEVFTFDAVDEYLVLEWSGTEWVTIKMTATAV